MAQKPKQMGYRAVKRRIEKANARLDHIIGNGVTDYTLHTCEDAKTLVRAIVEVHFVQYSDRVAALEDFDVVLSVQPGGQSVTNPSIGEVLDRIVGKNHLARYAGAVSGLIGGGYDTLTWELDSKGMRKLEEGDQIVWSDIALTANVIYCVGHVTLFFKE